MAASNSDAVAGALALASSGTCSTTYMLTYHAAYGTYVPAYLNAYLLMVEPIHLRTYVPINVSDQQSNSLLYLRTHLRMPSAMYRLGCH